MKPTTLALTLIFSFTLLFASCSLFKGNSQSQNTNTPEGKLVGIWTEHWGKDSLESETDVNYVDTLSISVNRKGEIKITCLNDKSYSYDTISLKDSLLSFTMVNKVDPSVNFIVKYSLIRISEREFTGEILNSNDKRVKVSIKKLR